MRILEAIYANADRNPFLGDGRRSLVGVGVDDLIPDVAPPFAALTIRGKLPRAAVAPTVQEGWNSSTYIDPLAGRLPARRHRGHPRHATAPLRAYDLPSPR
jgi:hypothetical protein